MYDFRAETGYEGNVDLLTHAVPELRIYQVWKSPIGPHPLGMFEVNLFTPGASLSYSTMIP